MTGGFQLLGMAANCHIVENSSLEMRTRRISYMISASYLSLMVAAASVGTILSALNYGYLFILIVVLHIINLFNTKIFIQDKVKETKEDHKLLNLKMLKTIFRRRENNLGIWSMILSSGLSFATMTGEDQLLLLFLQRKFNYNVTQSGLFAAFITALMTCGSIGVPIILNKFFKVSDYNLIIFGSILCGAAGISMAFIETEIELFTFSVLIFFKPSQLAAIKSAISKFLAPAEIGLYSSFDTISNAVLPVAFLPLYTYVFNTTLTTWPGVYNLISVCLRAFILLIAMKLSSFLYGDVAAKTEQNTANKTGTDSESGSQIEESHFSDIETNAKEVASS